ncbi:DUF4292 domain-containing protein [Ancylomarina sp. 16SWW S1-10-2]|uniref:DUF4292 domain-containing protein n=1 Tax=Ancylomarina sp. 16SWW S1-10-2 TaxID=2499681 RepID=UPI0012ADAF3C|nr:DUF4292 domain-containing protein [Ancylomarina sp. 16SWW S1-10-2]MRT93846.1 DUF4292 domain-containing protein [Ancylomarina sp. 16SWW S1-10-2]
MSVFKRKNSLLSIAVLLLMFLQFSCKSTYELGRKRAHGISDNKLYNQIADSSLLYKTLWVKRFAAHYESKEKSQSIRGSIKILRDSIIMVQINAPAGIMEVARLYITPDSVKMLDRIKKKYIVSDFSFLSEKLNMNVDFYTLQSILTNELFQLESFSERRRPFVRNFKSKVIDNKYVFISDKGSKVERKLRKDKFWKLHKFNYQRFEIDPSLMKITDVAVKMFGEDRDIVLKYRDFIDLKGQKFPSELVFKVKDSIQSLSCKLKYNKLEIDEDLKFPFKVSSKFERIYPE